MVLTLTKSCKRFNQVQVGSRLIEFLLTHLQESSFLLDASISRIGVSDRNSGGNDRTAI